MLRVENDKCHNGIFIGAEDNSETGLSAQAGAQSLLEGFTFKT